MKKLKKIPYGLSYYPSLINHNFVYVDKTMYIEKLEAMNERSLFFLRPRRFGKSLFTSMLQHYYGKEHKDSFDAFFGPTYIGKNPTPNANRYAVLKFDFSAISSDTEEMAFESFGFNIDSSLKVFNAVYSLLTKPEWENVRAQKYPGDRITLFFSLIKLKHPDLKIYILIDECDHFANELLLFNFDHLSKVVSHSGYVRNFYEAIKAAAGGGIVERMFVTGVTPLTLDSFTKGFKLASNVSLEPHLNEMMGFTEEELRWLIRETCEEGKYDEDKLTADMAALYNGSLFHPEGKARVYNPVIVLFFLSSYTQGGYRYPAEYLDPNVGSGYGKLNALVKIKTPDANAAVVNEIIANGGIASSLTSQFSFERDFTNEDFVSLLFYNGLLTVKDAKLNRLNLMIPNYVFKELYWRFFADYLRFKANITIEPSSIKTALRSLAQENDMAPLAGLMETIVQQISSHDLMQFDEKHIKLVFLLFISLDELYLLKCEPEISRQYPDLLLLFKKPYIPNFQFLIEFRYLKTRNKKQLAKVIQEAHAQVKGYLEKEEIKQLENLKSWIIVFAGAKIAAVEESGLFR